MSQRKVKSNTFVRNDGAICRKVIVSYVALKPTGEVGVVEEHLLLADGEYPKLEYEVISDFDMYEP